MEKTRAKPFVGRRSSVGTGTTSLLMIFTVLCFATLAMLSLSTANSSLNMQRRSLASNQSIAAAKGEAAVQLAQLDEALLELQSASTHGDADVYYDKAKLLAAASGWQWSEEYESLSYIVPVDENNELVTEIMLGAPNDALRYTMVRQVTRMSSGWTPEEGPGVWDGTF